MDKMMRDRLTDVPLRNRKADLRDGEGVLRNCSDAGHVVARALERAGIQRKEAAATMGISDSLLTRQLNNTEHLSWQRLNLLPNAFKKELLIGIADDLDGVTIRTQIDVKRQA